MSISALASAPLEEILRPKPGGVVVNPHVVAPAQEPGPDYDRMQRVLRGNVHHGEPKREEP